MKIIELIKKYPNVRFCELKSTPNDDKFCNLSSLDDFLDMTQKVGYVEETFSEEKDIDSKFDDFLHRYVDKNIPLNDLKLFGRYFNDKNCEAELKQLLAGNVGTNLYLYSLDSNIMFENCEVTDEDYDEEYDKFAEHMDGIVKAAFEYRESCVEEIDKIIREFIMSYKEQYNAASTKTNKDKIIQTVQCELRQKFGLHYNNDYRARKFYIENLFNS